MPRGVEAFSTWVVDPFACTEPMKQWARYLTRDAKTDLDKAKALFDGLAVRQSVPGQTANRTAREVFTAWKDTDTRLVCADHAVLLVALARAVGLDAFYVDVTRGPDGTVFWHACVAVFFEDRALLVDSAQQWFGIPHQEYTILDDLQAVAHRGFVNRQNSSATVAACQAALKLWPDLMSARLNLAYALLATRRLDEAQVVLDDIGQSPAIDAMAGGYWCCRGQLAMYRHEWDEVKSCMHKAVSLYPRINGAYEPLAIVYWQEGRLAEARAAFRAAMRSISTTPEDIRFAREAIAKINEQIGFDEVGDTIPDEPTPADVPPDSEATAGD